MATEIKLPALKENVDTVEVNAVRVRRATRWPKIKSCSKCRPIRRRLDVPSPSAGRVTEVRVKIGEQIKVGQVICLLEGGGNGEAAKGTAAKPAAKKPEAAAEPAKAMNAEAPAEAPKVAAPKPTTAPAMAPVVNRITAAGPATRRLARELGIDLTQVVGSGRAGRIIEEDVKGYVRQLASNGAAAPSGAAVQAPPLPNFEQWGPVERQPMLAVRKATARQMSLSWSLIPHVTQHDLADITDLEAFRKSQDAKKPKLTVTAFALKAVAVALREFPNFNSSLDTAGNQLILKKYIHVGVAVDTENGLLVPVIRDVDKKSVAEMAEELTGIAERARQRKSTAPS